MHGFPIISNLVGYAQACSGMIRFFALSSALWHRHISIRIMTERWINWTIFFIFFFGVHPLRMTTTSSSTLKTQHEETESMCKEVQSEKGCTVPSPLSWPSTKKFDGTKEFATTDSMDGCNVRPKTQLVGTRLRVDTTRVSSVGVPFPLVELPERGQSLTSNRL